MEDISAQVDVDAVIVGGGIAGLWTLARLRAEGFNAVLLESEAIGAGQTRYAQGIIHGGTKYALTGKLTASSEAVANMPSIWRACHAGNGEVDLSGAVALKNAIGVFDPAIHGIDDDSERPAHSQGKPAGVPDEAAAVDS